MNKLPADPWADDCLSRKAFGDLLLACLQGESIFSEEAFVVALIGKFGTGKSHFLRMWQADLERKTTESPDKYPAVVRVNAWESDFSGEPLLALVFELIEQLDAKPRGKKYAASRDIQRGLASVLSGFRRAGQDIAFGFVEEKTGVAPEGVLEAVSTAASGSELDRRAKALFADFKSKRDSIVKLRKAIGGFIEQNSSVEGAGELKLILIVDELDRCDPRYAIEFLEAIKHVFNVRGLAVVLGVDWDQMSCTARALFGGRLNVDEYFRKFVKRKVNLPEASSPSVQKLGSQLAGKYFGGDVAGSRSWKSIRSSNSEKLLGAILDALDLTPRQLEGAFHLLSCFYQFEEVNSPQRERENYAHEFFIAGVCIGHPKLKDLIVSSPDMVAILKGVRANCRGAEDP